MKAFIIFTYTGDYLSSQVDTYFFTKDAASAKTGVL